MIKGCPSSHTYISQRLRLHYVDWGNESAPPLLLVHGGQDHCNGLHVVIIRSQPFYTTLLNSSIKSNLHH